MTLYYVISMFNLKKHRNIHSGFTLIQILFSLITVSILAAIAIRYIGRYQKYTHLQQAQVVLLQNSQYMEQHYQRHLSYKLNSISWPKLYIPRNKHFCFKLMGDPRSHSGDTFSIKAVALDNKKEPRILKINRHGTVIMCQKSVNNCEDDNSFFNGHISLDKNCTIFNR